jgi:DNA mismatch endonuclease (patch repair protein)
VDTFSKAKRRRIMQAVRQRGTAPEAEVRSALTALGLVLKCNADYLPGKPDFVCPSAGLVLFVHGCFWHGRGRCRKGRRVPATRSRYWQQKVDRNRRRDQRVARKLRTMGYRVFTVWECEVKRHGIPQRLITAVTMAAH